MSFENTANNLLAGNTEMFEFCSDYCIRIMLIMLTMLTMITLIRLFTKITLLTVITAIFLGVLSLLSLLSGHISLGSKCPRDFFKANDLSIAQLDFLICF